MAMSNTVAKNFALALICSVCCFVNFVNSQAVSQAFNGYDNLGCQVSTTPFGFLDAYYFDLVDYYDNNNKAVAVTGTGNWIFYDYPGYLGDSEVVILRSRSQCVPLQLLISRATSLKHVGVGADYRLPSITLYKGVNFTGREIFVTGDHSKALFGSEPAQSGWAEGFGSFIVTGNSESCWTLFAATAYRSTQLCVCGQNSSDFTPRLVRSNPFPPFNMVGSVRKGCAVEVQTTKVDETIGNFRNVIAM